MCNKKKYKHNYVLLHFIRYIYLNNSVANTTFAKNRKHKVDTINSIFI